jgi:tRNA(fMet)-specific endonuclease VapC
VVRALEQAVSVREGWSPEFLHSAVSQMFGRIKATQERRGTRIEDFDAAIAAHALALEATLVTARVDHTIRIPGLRVEDWSQG